MEIKVKFDIVQKRVNNQSSISKKINYKNNIKIFKYCETT